MNSKKKHALLLLGNTAVLLPLYFVLAYLGVWFITPIYIGLATILGLLFILYNQGFAAKNATPEQLPASMTMDEKLAFIENGKKKLARSRWMLTLILPLILAVLADMIYLYLIPYFTELFK